MLHRCSYRLVTWLVVGLAALVVVPSALATPPGENGRIAFAWNVSGEYQIYTIGSHGHGLRQLTHASGGAASPDWSPNGRWIVFEQSGITFMHPDGTHLRTLPRLPESVSDYQPSYTPGGGRIVFGSLVPSELEDNLWVERTDGSHRIFLYNNDSGVGYPAVSPDGHWVTFNSSTGDVGGVSLDLMGIDGQDLSQFLSYTLDVGPSDWSPNGRRIAFSVGSGDTDRPGNIATVRTDGTSIRWLTHYQDPLIHASVGSYSPDGRWIVYTVSNHGRYAMMRMHADGSNKQTLLPYSPLNPSEPDWGPLPTT